MRKLVSFMHISLDGFTTNSQRDKWIGFWRMRKCSKLPDSKP